MAERSTEIVLVRHGQTEWNRVERFRGRVDIPLNARGVAQAEADAKRIGQKYRPVAIYTSPLGRAVKTAEPIAKVTGLPVQILDGLVDVSFGDWQGLTLEEAEARYPLEYRIWLEEPQKVQIPGGETLDEVRRRVVAAVEEVADKHAGETIVLVSHRAVCKVLLCAVLDLDNSHYWNIEQDNGAINVFVRRDGAYTVKLLNETWQLELV